MQEFKSISLETLEKLNLDQSITKINTLTHYLSNLTSSNFSSVASELVQYGLWLYSQKKQSAHSAFSNALDTLETHLRRIDVLTKINSLERLHIIYCQFKVVVMQKNSLPQINNKPGSFTDHYFRFRMNQDIKNPNLDSLALIEWLIIYKPELLHEENYNVIIQQGIIAFNDGKHICQFLLKHAKSSTHRNTALLEAVQHAHITMIKDLLDQHFGELPTDITCYEALLPCLIATKELKLLEKIEKIFSRQQLFRYSLDHFDYKIAEHYLSLATLPDDIHQLSHVVSLAASAGDIAFVNKILSKYPGDHTEFCRRFITPFYQPKLVQSGVHTQQIAKTYGGDQDIYRLEFNRMVSVILYYKKMGLFTYSLSEERAKPHVLGPKRLGFLKKIMQFSKGHHPDNFLFGSLRNTSLFTSLEVGTTDFYFRQCDRFFRDLAICNPDDINHSIKNGAVLEYTLRFNSMNSLEPIPLTCYRGTREQGVLEWNHTQPQYFEVLSEFINITHRILSDNSTTPAFTTEKTLCTIARTQYYLAQGNFYQRGSGGICELAAHAEFRSIGMLHPAITPLRSDCCALMNNEESQYVESYPNIFGCKTFKELHETCGREYQAYQVLDRVVYDIHTNSVIQLSDLQKSLRSKTDKNPPGLETLLRRAAGFCSNTVLQQILLFSPTLDQQDDGKFKRTALHWAVIEGRLDNAKTLIAAGASSDILDANKKTTQEYAIDSETPEIRDLFPKGLTI